MSLPEAIRDAIEYVHLPSPPQILLRFLRLAKDEQCSMADLAMLVGQDPALCAHVFSVTNPSVLQQAAGATRIIHCLSSLGTRLIQTLASTLVMHDVFTPPVSTRHYDITSYWGHSLRIAEMSRLIAAAIGYPDAEEAYLSGLLHDTGQMLLLGGMGERYGTLLELSMDESVLLNLEVNKLGVDHAEIGAWLVDQWGLSSFMADSILFHHKSVEEISVADRLIQIVWSAHAICNHYTPETLPDDITQSGRLEAAHIISDHYKLLGLAQKVHTPDLSAVNAMLGIDTGSVFEFHQKSFERVTSIANELGITVSTDSRFFPHKGNLPLDSMRLRMNDDDKACSQLNDAVRDMASMQLLQHDLAQLGSESEILHAARASVRILFGHGQFAFLMLQPDKPVLSGAHVDNQPGLLQQLEIPLDASQSLAAAAANGKRPRSTLDAEQPGAVSLTDIQVCRALGSEGILYLPMNTRKGVVGVMAFGIHPSRSFRLQKSIDWLLSFAHSIALSIDSLRDLQKRERSHEALLARRFEQQARKMIHEAGNPLGIIKNYLTIMRRKLPEQTNTLQELDILSEEIDRVTDLIRNMGSQPEEVPLDAALDINSLIESMLVLYGDSLFSSRGIRVETSLDPRLVPISGSRDSFKQILVNLWNNASDAMSHGDSLHVSTACDVNQNGRPYLEIRVTDTGPGLPQDVMQTLFQPLSQNRRPGHAGLGLSIVAALVEKLDGSITCRSTAGRGTSFSILLPQPPREEK